MMGSGSAQSAVDSLLGHLSSALMDEAQLLSGVRGDMKFIKEEMEIMQGFIKDVSKAEPSHQVDAWTRQIRDLAGQSQNCVDRYLHTFGAIRPSAGILASLRQAPRFVRTIPDRHRLAKELRELKGLAREAGERRQRYCITVPPAARGGSDSAAERKLRSAQASSDPQRRRALADARRLLDIDASAREVTLWLNRGGDDRSPENLLTTVGVMRKLFRTANARELLPHISKIVQDMSGYHQGAHHVDEALAFMDEWAKDALKDVLKDAVKRLAQRFAGESVHRQAQGNGGEDKRQEAAEEFTRMKTASSPRELAKAAVNYARLLVNWLWHMSRETGRRPTIFVIVTPPVDVRDLEDGEDHMHSRMAATELARKVWEQSCEASRFQCMAWIDAKEHSNQEQRLRCLLKQLYLYQGQGQGVDSKWDEVKLKEKIQEHLKDKKFLIVVANHEDDAPWNDIIPAMPPRYHRGSIIIVTPLIQQMVQYHFWYIASKLPLYDMYNDTYRYHVHFYPQLEAVRHKANQLLDDNEDLEDTVKDILKKCRFDPFAANMFLHALYANPFRSKHQVEELLDSLREFSTVSNARQVTRFCYDDVPGQYKICLLYLSIFPQGQEIRKSSLVRRWAAENLITRTLALEDLTTRTQALHEAERGFFALIDRGLVLPCNVDPAGKVKSCKLHPQVFSFVRTMARAENIVNTDLPHPDLAHRLSIRLQQSSNKRQTSHFNACWRQIHKHTTPTDPHDTVTSLMGLLSRSSQLGLVKVLDLEGCQGLEKKHLKNICNHMFHLKYLSLRKTYVTELPREIKKLRYLETLDIRQTSISAFPGKEIILPKLIHLLAGCMDCPTSKSFSTVHIPHGIGSMTNMQILSHVEIGENVNPRELEFIGQLQQLMKLGVVIHLKEADLLKILLQVIGKLYECLHSLSVHIKASEGSVNMDDSMLTISPPKCLQSLKINGRISSLPNWVQELHQLSKITLCRTSLTESAIKMLGKLANLRCMRLLQGSYTQKNLTFFMNYFSKLEILIIEGLDISDIQFVPNSAPKLEKIVWNFTSEKIILSDIRILRSLRVIELNGNCSMSDVEKIEKDAQANASPPIVIHNRVGTVAARSTVPE